MTTKRYDWLYDNHIDDIDAAIFSGEIFLIKENREAFREMLQRLLCKFDNLDKGDEHE